MGNNKGQDIESVWGRNSHKFLNHSMLRDHSPVKVGGKTISMRDFVIEHAKAPLMKVVIAISKRWPEPTHENCIKPNSHILIDAVNKFFEYENNPGREPFFRALFRIVIGWYEHDSYYSYRADWFVELIMKLGWKRHHPNRPCGITWKEHWPVESR